MDEQDGSNTLVIYHGQCSDGLCAAWVARKVLPNAQFFPAIHGQPPPDVSGKDVYLFDFAYKRPTILEMHERAKSLAVIDHHKTAAKDLSDLPFCTFDMSRSGATLAWEHFKNRIKGEMPWLVSYVEDSDLCKFSLPFSREINASLNSYPFDFKVWDALERVYPTSYIANTALVHDGKVILRFRERLVEMVLQHARRVELDGYRVMAANTSVVHGEVASKLAQDNPFGVAWYRREDGKIVHSLRSIETGVDVSVVAHNHGGGGHLHSAGFETTDVIFKEVS